ncbi:MAG TPA: TonB-dependent receptor, partial [Acetobacteraceae bacterium]|nr:TonB-dependent receptor [Acetobacteraceae bacterium]
SQRILNGNAFGALPCAPESDALCDDEGNKLLDRAGNPITNFLNGGPYSQLNLEAVDSNGYGASLQGLIYYTNLSQRILNGNAFAASPCTPAGNTLCDDEGNPLLDRAGNPITDFLNGGPYSQLNLEAVDSNGYGASLQLTHDSRISGRHNLLVVGISIDRGISTYTASSVLGGITSDNGVFIGPGITIDQRNGPVAPVRLDSTNTYYGAYVADVFDLTPRLALSLAGRMNVAQIDLQDRIGSALTGNHSYTHFNPGIGITYRLVPQVSVYASYSEANRAPTPAELSCASPQSPCTLANFFTGDPDLKQVVAHTVEAGLRGMLHPATGATLDWKFGLFRTNSDDDILFVASSVPGLAYFQNAGRTRRQGIEAGITWQDSRLHAWANYAFTEATFQTGQTLFSPLNPAADPAGEIHVVTGDRLPGVPAHRFKFGVSYAVTKAWTVGFSGVVSSGQYLFGDEANLTPKTSPYVVLNINSQYHITPNVEVFGLVQNLLNAQYATYGTYSPTSLVPYAKAPNATDTRSLAPAAPIAAYGGVRIRF